MRFDPLGAARPGVAFPTALLACLAFLLAAVPVAEARPEFRGFQLHSLWADNSNTDMDRELDLVQRSGANSVRVDVAWSSLEAGGKGSRASWYVTKMDRLFQAAQARGLKVLASVSSTPCWASSAPDALKQSCSGEWWTRGVTQYPPTNAADYADVVRWFTARYGAGLSGVEIWNEPNLDRFLKAADQAAAYAPLVKAAYPAAKAGNANVPVIAGVIGHADRPFLERLYAQGIKGHYDGLSIHPYNESRDPYDRWLAQWTTYTFLPGIESIHAAQLAAGDGTPLWITEFGWSTCSSGGWCVDEARQADYLPKAFQILDTLPYVKAGIVYNLRDNGTDRADLESNWGVVRRDYSEKPGYAAVTRALTGGAPIPAPTPAPEPTTSPTPTPTTSPRKPRKPRRAALTLRVAYASGKVYARGRAPRGKRLKLRVHSCRSKRAARPLRARVSRKGRYHSKLGRAKRLRGCRVVVAAGRTRVAIRIKR